MNDLENVRECSLAECGGNAQYGNPLSGLGSQCRGGTSCHHLLPSSSSPPTLLPLTSFRPLFRFQLGCIGYSSVCTEEHRLGFNPA